MTTMKHIDDVSRYPNFIIGRVSEDDELECVVALNDRPIERNHDWNTLLRATHKRLCAATGEDLIV